MKTANEPVSKAIAHSPAEIAARSTAAVLTKQVAHALTYIDEHKATNYRGLNESSFV